MNGFIYIMTNPTVPGLAKVGMTTRAPTTRQSELSQATGVASPFILVYSQPVKNCRAAEAWVHKRLDLAGFRHAANREFFKAPLHEIVRIVADATEIGGEDVQPTEEFINENEPDNLDGRALKRVGDSYFLGKGVIKNPLTALQYYKLALNAKYWQALPSASSILRGGHGLKEDPETELELINAAANAGQWCFLPLAASLFARQGQFGIESAEGAWITYFSNSLPLIQKLEEEESLGAQREQAVVMRQEAAAVALEALEFAVDGKVDTSQRGWWKVLYMLADQLNQAIELKYPESESKFSTQRKTALLWQVINAQIEYLGYVAEDS